MENFTAYIPTKVHFGKDVTDQLGNITKQYGQKVLLVYGKGSIKRNGIYQRQGKDCCIHEPIENKQVTKSQINNF